MNKASTSPREPSAATLKEMPEIDFAQYRVRKNRFARRIAREGMAVVHQAPSTSSLREMPEPDLAQARPSPYALQIGRGRPLRAAEVGPTVTRSVRLPPKLWAALEERARAEGITVHALIRRAILDILDRGG